MCLVSACVCTACTVYHEGSVSNAASPTDEVPNTDAMTIPYSRGVVFVLCALKIEVPENVTFNSEETETETFCGDDLSLSPSHH